MLELFRLEKEEFSKKDNELQWTYLCRFNFTFKKRIIQKITITDHPWKKKGREGMSRELILDILKEKINGIKRMRPDKKWGNRDIFIRKRVNYDHKKYKLVFWFKDGTDNHL